MPKSKEFISSDSESDSDGKPKQKKAKKEKKPEKANTSKGPDGEELIELGKKKFVSVKEFRGTKYIHIREYYTDDKMELKPGKKGIALDKAQWEQLKSSIKDVDALL